MVYEPYSGEPVTVSAVITAGMKSHLLELGGGAGLSAGLRYLMTAHCTTPSGAAWCPAPELMPDPAEAAGPGIFACAAGVVASGIGPSTLIVDTESNELLILDGDDPDAAIVRPLTLAGLAALAASLLPAVLAVVDSRAPDGALLPLGLQVRLLAPGVVAIGSGVALVALDLQRALQLCSELSSLLARQVAGRQVVIHGMERAMQAEPAVVAT